MATIDDILKSVGSLEKKIDEVSKDKEAGQEQVEKKLKELGEEQLKLGRQLLDVQQKSLAMPGQAPAVKSVGDMIVEGDSYKAMRAGQTRATKTFVDEVKREKAEAADPITTPTGGIVQAYRRPGVLPGTFRPFTIEGLLPSVAISSNSFEVLQEDESQYVENAAIVAEGGTKPTSSTGFKLLQGTIQTVANTTRITKQLLDDTPALAAYINLRLVYGVDLNVENELMTGDGTSGHLSGMLSDGNYTPHGVTALADLGGTGANLFDLILRAKTKITRAYNRPNCILLNPQDWETLCMLKDADGRYILGGPVTPADPRVWGLPVWTTEAVPESKFLVGDFYSAGMLYTRQGMTVELFEQDQDNVIRNLVTVRAERRMGFGIEKPSALCGGDFVLPTA
ncbi:phage major capsid protein [Sutterella sp.]|uniref:phage major capsid protein n=1 Tax=Sutterella sp. TaxID=1981025 RepID=UPI0026DF41FD|nr:phage major capsid protein [Sutterella sp.]MDO5531418.1 phage major capsid protein [Sutterella sp.]